MHSSGRGEDSPEAYRGVVLPSGQQQQPQLYGEHVQPAGGSPWGAAEQAPEPADSTQMLPPYPGGDPMGPPAPAAPQTAPPVPVADATQMLPPYPGGDPGRLLPPQSGPGAMPPVPPQAPRTGQVPLPAPAEATQALPVFHEQQGGPGYEQQGGYDQQGYGGPGASQPSYGGQETFGHDSYGGQSGQGGQDSYGEQGSYGGQESFGQDSYGGQGQGYAGDDYEQQQSGPAHDSDYDHLFRSDVPSPAPVRPRIIQPPDRQQPAQPFGQDGGRPPYGQQPGGYDQGYDPQYPYDGGDDGTGGRRKMSAKAIIGIVVAGCVVAGLVVGGLLNSGGGGDKTANTADKSSVQPSAGSSASGSGASASADPVKQQASALDSLLGTSDTSRSSVVSAVESIKGCDKLSGAASDLHTAATQRKTLVTKLAALSVDKLPDHGALTDSLTKAWQASSGADTHYANWATQAQNNHKVCSGGHARTTAETQAGDRESGTATIEKKRAVKLWNSIARKYGLTQRQYSQL
jgi:hypothetical protein